MANIFQTKITPGQVGLEGVPWTYSGSFTGTLKGLADSASWAPLEALSFNEQVIRHYTGSFAGGTNGNNNFTKEAFYPISEWQKIPIQIYGGRYNDSSMVLNLSSTSKYIFKTGLPIRYYNSVGTYNYGILRVVDNADTTIYGYISGGPLSTSYSNYIDVAGYDRVIKLTYVINGWFADGAETTLIANDLYSFARWEYGKAYLTKISHRARVQDTGATQPKVNVTLGGRAVSTSNTNTGRAIMASWVDTDVDINTSNYYITYDETIEITVTGDGTNKDAQDLTVSLTFVLE